MDFSQLAPGDCLLFLPSSFFGLAISIKTWHAISHVEIYAGQGQDVGSRDGQGVNIYPTRTDHAGPVLRPTQPFDFASAMKWFETVKGQGYAWLGLLRFSWRSDYIPPKLLKGRQFCSEFATNFYRAGGLDPFPRETSDAVAPFEFLDNPFFSPVAKTTPGVV